MRATTVRYATRGADLAVHAQPAQNSAVSLTFHQHRTAQRSRLMRAGGIRGACQAGVESEPAAPVDKRRLWITLPAFVVAFVQVTACCSSPSNVGESHAHARRSDRGLPNSRVCARRDDRSACWKSEMLRSVARIACHA